ncbi:peptidyl-tRNA hydrolase PTRHD1 [Pelobates cultripes]|uniref:peptidyl-tRNA hydrolase n=1 Tax=Pelobates cultripes TaxID=61616 RepID=A0AAD1VS98_PELCU|nr:peptidyl-tRNA hydrolase PTRHD1 [Pelobates cultripes]
MPGLVQYIVLRRDLQAVLGWPLGALVAQACHAATAAIHLYYQNPETQQYLQELDTMHKVLLEVPDEATLTSLAETLKKENIDHKAWIEQPENITTCIALRPYPKEQVHPYLKKFKLLK